MPAYLCVWEYDVAPKRQPAFLRAYGPDGLWARLFRRAPGYVCTELFGDRGRTHRFVTFDYWESESSWRRFRQEFAKEYEALDARCARLTQREVEVGRFVPVAL